MKTILTRDIACYDTNKINEGPSAFSLNDSSPANRNSKIVVSAHRVNLAMPPDGISHERITLQN